MAPKRRILVRRDLEQAGKLCDRIGDYIARSGIHYEKAYPDLHEIFGNCFVMTTLLKNALEELRLKL